MKKARWRQMLLDIYHEEMAQELRRFRERTHKNGGYDEIYIRSRLFKAAWTVRFALDTDGDNDDSARNASDEVGHMSASEEISGSLKDILKAHHHFNEGILLKTGMAESLELHYSEILSELEVSDLPAEDVEALRHIGSPHPRSELRLRIDTIRRHYLRSDKHIERPDLCSRVRKAGEILDVQLHESDCGQADRPSRYASRPSRYRWFKGLGSLCRGTVLTAVDLSLLASMWNLPFSQDTTIIGAIASIATGIGDIAIGVGEFRGE